MLGLVFGEGKQQFDYHTLQGHRCARHAQRLALQERARRPLAFSLYRRHRLSITVRSAATRIRRTAICCSREGARADTEPKLEIEADDVRCTHGATVGPIDEEQLFYATQPWARRRTRPPRLIVEGFFARCVREIRRTDVSPRSLQE